MIDAASRQPAFALGHDWLCTNRGGEAVLDAIAQTLAQTGSINRLYTMTDSGISLSEQIDTLPRTTSMLQRIPMGPTSLRRWLFPLYPSAIDRLSRTLASNQNQSAIDLLVTTSSCAIKGLAPPRGIAHVCFCHSPARYAWALSENDSQGLKGVGLKLFGKRFCAWDRKTAAHVTHFVANSSHIARRIRACYDRPSIVIHPPVNTEFYSIDPDAVRQPIWLAVGALEPYKRFDLAIAAAKLAGAQLHIVGGGTQRKQLQILAGDALEKSIFFLGRVSDEQLRTLYRTCQLLVFPQVEDFGIIAVEAQACGLPVVARAQGGALDTVIHAQTGAFFDDPTPQAIVQACKVVPNDAQACAAHAQRFSAETFNTRFKALITKVLADPECDESELVQASDSCTPTMRPMKSS